MPTSPWERSWKLCTDCSSSRSPMTHWTGEDYTHLFINKCNLLFFLDLHSLFLFLFFKHPGWRIPNEPRDVWTRSRETYGGNCRKVTGRYGESKWAYIIIVDTYKPGSYVFLSWNVNVFNCCFSFVFNWKTLVGPVPQFIPRHLICPLTKKMFVDPVRTVYGTVYERKAIEEHLKQWVNLLKMSLL